LGGYRYGFNGQEKTDEIAGVGNHTTAEFWEYDPRIGRRWNLDPSPNVSMSSYSAFENNPILLSDPLGDTVINGQKYEAKDFSHATFLASATVSAKRKRRDSDEVPHTGMTVEQYEKG
jgi:RHS repeat-associated protein